MIDPGLEGRVVVVTGVDNPQGIGAATARAFARQGASLFVTWVESRPDELLAELRGTGVAAEGMALDLADPAQVLALFDRVEAALGPVDVLVNNAAHWEPVGTFLPVSPSATDAFDRPQATLTAEAHDRHFAVNARAVALAMTEYIRRHIERGAGWGRIINLSTGGSDVFPGEVAYGASKAALESYSRSAAVEFGPYGVTVNIVSPGPTQTGWITQEMESVMAESSLLRRVGQPEDIADVIVFLASEQGRWLTGQTIHAGGGHRMV